MNSVNQLLLLLWLSADINLNIWRGRVGKEIAGGQRDWVTDPAGFYPDPNPTSEIKPDPTYEIKPDLDLTFEIKPDTAFEKITGSGLLSDHREKKHI